MAHFTIWLTNNWFSLLQSVGIICGLLFTAISIRRDTASRRAGDLLILSERHQELWAELYRRPELSRIRSKEVDLLANPVTTLEVEFLRAVFVHFFTGYLLARNGSLLQMKVFQADAQNFFSLPIPKAVWRDNRDGRDPEFVSFVEACLEPKSNP